MQYAGSGIADAFVAARRDGTAMSAYPGELPQTLADAYAIQALAIDRWPDAIGGWKVARINDPWRERLQADRYIGPIFARTIVDAGFVSKVPVYEGGSAAFEAEIALVVGSDTDPERLSWSLEDARSLITDVRLVIEAASSPFASIATLGPLAAITAFGNNSGLIRGPSVDLTSLRGGFAEVTIDGTSVGRSPFWGDPDGPLHALVFALERAAALGYPLRRGQIVSTGALTGVHTVAIGQMCSARFADLAMIDCVVTSRPANQ
jgi:2-keto-4-pentenoate hydratase